MILLYSAITSLWSISGIFAIPSSSFSSHCPCWTSASVLGCFGTGWRQPSYVVHFPSYFALSRSQSFGLLCLLLALLFCLLLAMLFSVLFIISPILDVERCPTSASSLRCSSRCPRTRVAPLSSFHHRLTGYDSVSDSHHLLLGCGSVCISLSQLVSWQWLCL